MLLTQRTVSLPGKRVSRPFARWKCLGPGWGSAAGCCGFCLEGAKHLSSQPSNRDQQPSGVAEGVGGVVGGNMGGGSFLA